jgi:hypothetical protein
MSTEELIAVRATLREALAENPLRAPSDPYDTLTLAQFAAGDLRQLRNEVARWRAHIDRRASQAATSIETVVLAETVRWCRANNARVRFESDGTVSVTVNRTTRRRSTIADAVAALVRRGCGASGALNEDTGEDHAKTITNHSQGIRR